MQRLSTVRQARADAPGLIIGRKKGGFYGTRLQALLNKHALLPRAPQSNDRDRPDIPVDLLQPPSKPSGAGNVQ